MRFKEGIPFVNVKSGVSGIVMGVNEDSDEMMYYYMEDNKFYKSYIEEKGCKVNGSPLAYMDLSAKIVSIEDSIALYGMQQRKEDLLGSVLKVVDIHFKNEEYAFTLQSYRNDHAQVMMTYSDLIFIYPTIDASKKVKEEAKIGATVKASKEDVCSNIKKGEQYLVINIEENPVDIRQDILTLVKNKGDKDFFFSYRKNFKLIQNELQV